VQHRFPAGWRSFFSASFPVGAIIRAMDFQVTAFGAGLFLTVLGGLAYFAMAGGAVGGSCAGILAIPVLLAVIVGLPLGGVLLLISGVAALKRARAERKQPTSLSI
jgi:hypothetical protein